MHSIIICGIYVCYMCAICVCTMCVSVCVRVIRCIIVYTCQHSTGHDKTRGRVACCGARGSSMKYNKT